MDRDAFLRDIRERLDAPNARLGIFILVTEDGNTEGTLASLRDALTPLHPLYVLGAVTQQAHALIAAAVREVVVQPTPTGTDDDVN